VGLRVGKDDIKSTIFNHGEFIAYTAEIENIFNSWKNEHLPLLRGLKVGEHPQQVIHELSESLLDAFSGCSLIDKYDVYQHLMSYWLETMRDDVYILVEDGWVAELTPIFNKKGTVTDYTCELIPKELIVKRYFMEEKGNIESLESQRDEMGREMEEMQEEYGGEEGLLEEVTNDAGNITKTNLTARIKEIKGDREYEEEMNVLRVYLKLMEEQTKLNKQIKDAEKQLNSLVLKQYQLLTAEEVKCLVIDDKWFPCLWESIQSEMERISQRLAQRILELADRYGETLSELENEVNLLTNKVEEHLKLII
ncbi:MAG: type I restriction endonuclease, partial [Crocosphaera sp.]|nr:type I restriction endonuclease [Crocosphaera sp.]